MDHQGMSDFLCNIYTAAYEDAKNEKALELMPQNDLTIEKLMNELETGAVKGIGTSIAAKIKEYLKSAGYMKAEQEEAKM